MKNTLFIACISISIILILSSVSLSVSSSIVRSDSGEKHTSPLFIVRTPDSHQQSSETFLQSSYLGINTPFPITFFTSPLEEVSINKVLYILNTQTDLISSLFEKMQSSKQYQSLLNQHSLSDQQVKVFGIILSENPELFEEKLKVFESINLDNSGLQPLGFETVFIECLITAIVLAPIVVVVTLLALFFTLRVLTCLNINDCASEIAQGILDNLSQGLQGTG
jgi:hypothetical protein